MLTKYGKDMNEEREGGMCLIATVIWAVVTVLCWVMCSSCSGKKVVTETVFVHDTLHTWHTDTVSVERWNWRHDTIRIETERVVTLLQADKSTPAETIRVETNNWHYQHEVVRDSASKVVARVDSILRALDKQREKQTVKTKPLVPWWQYGVFIAILVGCCVFVLKSRIF